MITLRPLKVEDAEVSFRWRNDTSLWKYTYNRPNHEIKKEEEMRWIEKVLHDPSRANFAIMLGDTYIGNIYLVNITGDTSAMGVFIGDKRFHGYGYGCAAIKLLKHEAKQRGITKILIHCSPNNIPAIISYLKCGAKLPKSWTGGKMIEMVMTTE